MRAKHLIWKMEDDGMFRDLSLWDGENKIMSLNSMSCECSSEEPSVMWQQSIASIPVMGETIEKLNKVKGELEEENKKLKEEIERLKDTIIYMQKDMD
jgi:cell division protein FtsB